MTMATYTVEFHSRLTVEAEDQFDARDKAYELLKQRAKWADVLSNYELDAWREDDE